MEKPVNALADFKMPEVRRARRFWYVEVFQYTGKWEFIGKGPATRTFGGEERKDWRDVVPDLRDAQPFHRKVDAERFAFRVATINPSRIGKIRVVRY